MLRRPYVAAENCHAVTKDPGSQPSPGRYSLSTKALMPIQWRIPANGSDDDLNSISDRPQALGLGRHLAASPKF